MMRFLVLIACLIFTCFTCFCTKTFANTASALQKIKTTGEITIGYRAASIPFSFQTDKKNPPLGYTMDVCKAVVDKLKVTLNLPQLKVHYVQVDGATRIPFLVEHKIDLECGASQHSMNRDKFVTFSDTILISENKAIVRKESEIKNVHELHGKEIVVVGASAVTQKIRQFELENNIRFKRYYAKDHEDGFAYLQSGKAIAYFGLHSVLSGLISKHKSTDDYIYLDAEMALQPVAIMMRRNDTDLKNLVNTVIDALAKNNHLAQLYDKWFIQNIPELGYAINLKMNQSTADLFKHPFDMSINDDKKVIISLYSFSVWLWGSMLVGLTIGLALAMLYFTHRFLNVKEKFDLSSLPLISSISISSLILAFCFANTLDRYNQAFNFALDEANSINLIRKMSHTLDKEKQQRIGDSLMKYLNVVVDQEWPDQREGLPVLSYVGSNLLDEISNEIAGLTTLNADPLKRTLFDAMTDLYKARNDRLVASGTTSGIQYLLWFILFSTVIISLFSICLVNFKNVHYHYIMITVVGSLYGLFLTLIIYVDRPYVGAKGISTSPFQIVMENF